MDTKPAPTTQPRKRYSLFVVVLGTLIPLLLLLTITEVTLRIVDPDLYYKNQFFPLNRDIDFSDVHKSDPRLFWRFRPNNHIDSRKFSFISYDINSRGMRNPEFPDEPIGYRIIALGNSCTFGWAVPEQDTWVRVLDRMLRERLPGQSIEVINTGVPGYSSFQGKRYFEDELVQLKPSMVLIMLGWNDEWPAGKGIKDKDQKPPPAIVIWLQNGLNQFKTYSLLRKLILSGTETETMPRLDEVKEPCRVSLTDFALNLKEIIRTARAHNIQPVLIVPPTASLRGYFKGNISDFHTRHERYQAQIRAVAEFDHVPLVDLQPPFDEFTDLFSNALVDPIHFNAKGSAVAARVLADSLAPIISATTR